MKILKQLAAAIKAKAAEVWRREPAMVLSTATTALLALGAAAGVTISHDTAGLVVELAVPLLLGGAIRSRVIPA